MGYQTDYNLTVKNVKTKEDFRKLLNVLKERNLLMYAFDTGEYLASSQLARFFPYQSVKWYGYEYDMTEISMLPECKGMVFELYGLGEDPTDQWKTYYKDGKSEECPADIVFPKPKTIRW